MSENHQRIIDEIYKAIDDIFEDVSIHQEVWMQQVARRELELAGQSKDERTKNRPRYELRLEFSGPSFLIRWLSVKFVRVHGKLVRIRTHISIPRSGRYSGNSFKTASEWELDMMLKHEDAFGPIRGQLKALMSAHRSICHSAKIGGLEVVTRKMPERVSRTEQSIERYKERFS